MKWGLIINFSLALIAILNPIGKIPIWEELTGDESKSVRDRIALLITLSSAVVLIIFLIGGKFILNIFQINLASFQIAGGILLLLTGISMVNGKAVRFEKNNEDGETPFQLAKQRFRNVAVPLMVPILAGPGSITTVMIYSFRANQWLDYLALAAVLTLMMIIIFFVFFISPRFEKKMDEIIFIVATRMFGLILAAIAIQFIVEGLGQVFPSWIEGHSVIENATNNNSHH